MKKFLLTTAFMALGIIAAIASTKELSYSVVAIYDEAGYDVPNYYVILSDSENAKYDHLKGSLSINEGYVLVLDMYNSATNPAALLPGTYNPKDATQADAPGVFDPDYSDLSYYKDGKRQGTQRITAPVTVECDEAGMYTITTTTTDPVTNETCDLRYTGRIPVTNSNEKPTAYVMMKKDVDVTMNGGIAFYQGVTDYSNNGVTYINLYSGEYDSNGAMKGDGFNLAMMVAHKRVTQKKDFAVFPGTYTNAGSLDRFTWYPCREIEYPFGDQTVTMPFGSFIRERKDGEYTYGYLESGEFTINTDEDGNVNGTLDAITNLGYHIKVTFSGPMLLNTDNATFKSAVSNLTDDVDLDFSKLETGRIWHTGLKGGCRSFIVDLGSPAGRDESINYGGDLLRMTFLSPASDAAIKPGLYTTASYRWNENDLNAGGTYEPMSLEQGFVTDEGTRYAHFKDGSYCVYDLLGPIHEGTVLVSTDDYINYTFEINLVDDAGFEIKGKWDNKPIEYFYSRDDLEKELSGITVATGDDTQVKVAVEGRNIMVLNGGDADIRLVDLNGRTVATGNAATTLDASSLPSNIYILRINNQSIKIALK